ncbi:MAG: hypothetical protein GY761_17170 [Hyphomicrobiales bacterium]|nr:hypothetical protein [Hyphomicrobiales bacterium]
MNRGLAFLDALRSDTILYVLVGTYALLSITYFAAMGKMDDMAYGYYVKSFSINYLILCPMVAFLFGITRIVHRLDNRRSLAFRYMFSSRRLGRFFAGLILLGAIMVFLGTFTSIKMALPGEQGFIHDRLLADIDRMLHFGVDPWRYVGQVVNAEFLPIVVINYNIVWVMICFLPIFWVAVSPRADKFRLRYFICYIFTWVILGNVLAKLLISAGPAFYGLVTGDELRFAGQLALLAENDDSANSITRLHSYLWQAYSNGSTGLGTGISAFPSVHVGLLTLNALFVREYRRWMGWLAFIYVGVIQISSFYLGWHYAIDGYASIIIVCAIYWLMKKVSLAKWGYEKGMRVLVTSDARA